MREWGDYKLFLYDANRASMQSMNITTEWDFVWLYP
jgi:hypothetical protein